MGATTPARKEGFARFDYAKLWQALDAERDRRGREGHASFDPFRPSYSWLRVWLGDCSVRPYLTYDGTGGDE